MKHWPNSPDYSDGLSRSPFASVYIKGRKREREEDTNTIGLGSYRVPNVK